MGELLASLLEWERIFLEEALLLPLPENLSSSSVYWRVMWPCLNFPARWMVFTGRTGSTSPRPPSLTEGLVDSRSWLCVEGMMECKCAIQFIVLKLGIYGKPSPEYDLYLVLCRAQAALG